MIDNSSPTLGNSEKPCTVETAQGFSVLYQNRYLYSKYAPNKAILKTISDLVILPNTLVLCFSPCLWYGIEELQNKLTEHSKIFVAELNKELYNFAVERMPSTVSEYDSSVELSDVKTVFFSSKNITSIFNLITSQFRRVVCLDLSAGVQFNSHEYAKLRLAVENTLQTFWKNRITLVKLGRLYSRNIFKNFANYSSSIPFNTLTKTISKPIVVLGAGPSIENVLPFIISHRNDFYVLAVDASLPTLQSFHITPDAIVAVESQNAILKYYIGIKPNPNTIIFEDLTGNPKIQKITGGKLSFFVQEYTKCNFLKNIQALNVPLFSPMGSVGLTAVYIALLLRQNFNTKIFVSGLDFSYPLGITHAKSTWPHVFSLLKTTRLKGIDNIASGFTDGSVRLSEKSFTTKSLMSYAALFAEFFSNQTNVFECGDNGIDLGLERVTDLEKTAGMEPIAITTQDSTVKAGEPQTTQDVRTYAAQPASKAQAANESPSRNVQAFLQNEESALLKIKSLLSLGYDSPFAQKELSLEEQVTPLIRPREYLYLHFPDGYEFKTDNSFIKRVRAELDFFLKDINFALRSK
jgi:hypothetical protein